ncbi:MAG TPA: von Willebrand factor type A domain-containing protein, partial [Chitinophagaceae bacterium]|nr:von Willebrand factor type A domain-containing protein [Chitinophagaceae bacterium]
IRVKSLCTILLCLFVSLSLSAQYYLRGEVKDEKGNLLGNAKMILHSTGYLYYAGGSGGYGLQSSRETDTVTVSYEGFLDQTVALSSNRFESIVLKMQSRAANLHKNHLVSVTKDMRWQERRNWTLGGETYSNLLENEFINAKKFPETGFSINTNKASYSNIRRFITMGSTIPPDAVRTEELLNYFDFGYTPPPKDSVFRFDSWLSACPWNAGNQLLFLKMCARKVNLDTIPPSNLVFLIDISGSMDMPNRLPLLKSAFKLMVNNLRDKDTVSIVVYGSTVGVWMQPTSGKEKEKIAKAIEELYPGGSTPGASGITTAYDVAKSKFIKGGNNRVILATDGDFNVGQTSDDELENIIVAHRRTGIYLTCLGVGMGNYKDSKLEVLAKKGNGNFAYLDNEAEAEKVLVKELTQTLYSVADDAYLSIDFNPTLVKEYRLIGFDNKVNAIADSLNELEGGEVGSGHTLLAMFELSPTASGDNVSWHSDKLASVRVNYKCPKDSTKQNSGFIVPFYFTEFNDLPAPERFATSIVEFATLVKNSAYAKNIAWSDCLILANESHNPNDTVQKEFVGLVEKAKKIYSKKRKNRND